MSSLTVGVGIMVNVAHCNAHIALTIYLLNHCHSRVKCGSRSQGHKQPYDIGISCQDKQSMYDMFGECKLPKHHNVCLTISS